MSDKLSFILFEKTNLPRYYEINKKIFKLALYGFPTIAFLCFAGTVLMGTYIKIQENFSQDNTIATPSSQIQIKNQTLLKENQELMQLNRQLQTKLAAFPPPAEKTNNNQAGEVPSSKKLTPASLSIKSPKAFVKNNKIHFHFNLSNQLKNQTRLRGFVHVIMKRGNKLFFWPAPSLPPDKLTAPYNSGEAFSTRYFRPVESIFPVPSETSKSEQKYFFFITVYNTVGDIIHQETLSPAIDREAEP